MVKKNSTDTLSVTIEVNTNMFYGTIKGSSFLYNVKVVLPFKREEIPSREVAYLSFNDSKGNKQIFVSDSNLGSKHQTGKLIRQDIKGRISIYTVFSRHPYDGAEMPSLYVVKDKKNPKSFFTSRKFKRFKLLTQDVPEISNSFEKLKKLKAKIRYKKAKELLIRYNKIFE